jgi:asparagine synthase (glutamine-hydrolysing)
MCGIAGFLSSQRDAPAHPDDVAAVRRMCDALRHRGPDAEGLWTHGPCVLGHRRLSIIDLSDEARQPILNEDGQVAAVVNGELYDFARLRQDLEAHGHRFRSGSDSEVVVHRYEDQGERCVDALRGMFSLAAYDARRQTLLLARDPAGKKPLFYRSTARGLAFASEVHALVTAFPAEPAEPDLGAVDEYLTLMYVPSPRTAFRGVFKLPAAHVVEVAPGGEVRPRRYWFRPRGEVLRGSTEDLARELRALMTEAVRKRLVSDVPLGAFLSGGVDSSTVVALMAGLSPRPVKTFSIGFPHAGDSELHYARRVARRYRTEHHELVVSPDMTRVVEDIVAHHGEPFADSSAVATWYLAEMTRKHVTVALSGDASDEAFAGYKRYNPARIGHLHDRLGPRYQKLLRGVLVGAGRAVYPYLARFAERLGEGEATRYLTLVGQFTPAEKERLYLQPLREARSGDTVARFERVLRDAGGTHAMARLLELDAETYLVDDINVKVDIAAMAHGLEVRCPFLDSAVVEFAARLPLHALQRVRGKYLVRRAFRDLLPASIVYRTKKGFALPLERWLRTDLRAMTRDVLQGPTARARGIFDPGAVDALLDALDRGRGDADRLWTLLMLELWFQRFIDRRGA